MDSSESNQMHLALILLGPGEREPKNSIPITSPMINNREKCENFVFFFVVCDFCILYRAQEELVRVNQAYQDVLANTDAKTSYDQLCVFRKVRDFTIMLYIVHDCFYSQNYPFILEQKVNSLLNAQDRLKDLRKKLKRFRCPQSLLEELDNGIQLVQIRIDKLLN